MNRKPHRLTAVGVPLASAALLATTLVASAQVAPPPVPTSPVAYPVADIRKALKIDWLDNGITAHRGWSGAYPENTMISMEKGIELGADWIELDVFVSADGQVVVNHDTTTGRTGDQNLLIEKSTWDELKTVDVAHAFRQQYGLSDKELPFTRMPLLSETLKMVKKQGRTRVSIQPKTIPAVDAAVAVVKELGAEQWVGFNDGSLPGMSRVKELDPNLHVFWDTNTADIDGSIATALDRGFEAIVMNQSRVNPESIRKIQAAGMEAGAWTINDMGVAKKFWDWGIDRVYTDHAREALMATGQDTRPGLSRNLIAHWTFDDTGKGWRKGITSGDTPNPRQDGRLTGYGLKADPSTGGKLGGAVEFDGWREYVDVPAIVVPAGSGALTASTWFKPAAPGSTRQTIFETSGQWSISLELTAGTGRLKFSIQDGTEIIAESGTTPTANEWHHAALTYDAAAGQARLYFDGAEVTSFPYDAKEPVTSTTGLASNTGLHFGTHRDANDRWFSGAIDDTAIWNRVLTGGEIDWLWNGGLGHAVPKQ
ncbi:glycerophosphodiester phosphodiesterase family protein [Micromonospora sp. NPDC047074]|uniref:glycerophosphodiester phosphodiesterase family protein n=1 Tax=Micromonospora sp. NPDC047074 TaxID=3154339 RepID=UPI0033C44D3E